MNDDEFSLLLSDMLRRGQSQIWSRPEKVGESLATAKSVKKHTKKRRKSIFRRIKVFFKHKSYRIRKALRKSRRSHRGGGSVRSCTRGGNFPRSRS